MNAEKFKIIYFGTGKFSVPPLQYLAEKHDIISVITQPDAPSGRKMKLTASPVKKAATELDLPILQPENIKKNKEFHELVKNLNADFIIVVSYGQIIPKIILEATKYYPINIHGSILPKYRGASPIQQTLLNGDKETGVTFIEMDEGIDTGDIILIKKMKIEKNDTLESLSYKLSHMGGLLISNILEDIAIGALNGIAQNNENASYCKKIKKEDGRIRWQKETAEEICNKLKAFTPWPGCFSFLDGKRVKIIEAEIANETEDIEAGIGHQTDKKYFIVGTASGNIKILKLQVEGKKEMSSEDFLRGYTKDINFREE